MKHLMLPLIWLVVAFVITGCATSELPPSKLQGVSIDEDGNYLYRLGVGDEVNVFVWANSEVTGDYLIGPDGRINVALLSPIPAVGLTTKELQDKLKRRCQFTLKSLACPLC